MTTAIESQYHFTAEVKSKGKQQNQDGWAMLVDWKLPGSQYDPCALIHAVFLIADHAMLCHALLR